jgi:hypothetical protein
MNIHEFGFVFSTFVDGIKKTVQNHPINFPWVPKTIENQPVIAQPHYHFLLSPFFVPCTQS